MKASPHTVRHISKLTESDIPNGVDLSLVLAQRSDREPVSSGTAASGLAHGDIPGRGGDRETVVAVIDLGVDRQDVGPTETQAVGYGQSLRHQLPMLRLS